MTDRGPQTGTRRESPEREIKRRNAWIEKFDLEVSVRDGHRLSDQLIQARFGNRAIALPVDVNSVSGAWRLSIDQHAKAHRSSARRWSQDEIEVAGMKAVSDPPLGLVEYDGLFPYRPITRKGPMIESQLRGSLIDVRLVQYRSVARHEVLGALIADIGFRRPQVAPIG